MEASLTFLEHLDAQPSWFILWIYWVSAINGMSFFFLLRHISARWIFSAWSGTLIGMMGLYSLVGFTPLLGLIHLTIWTPMLFYLVRGRQDSPSHGLYGFWLRTLVITICFTLLMDSLGLFNYVIGNQRLLFS